MRIPRIYHPERLDAPCEIDLSEDAANHVGRVLRMSEGHEIQLFDGSNQIFTAHIIAASKKNVRGSVEAGVIDERESPLHLH